MDLFGRRGVGGRDHIEGELCDAKLAAFYWDGVDGLPGVGLLRAGDACEILRQALAVEAADEDLRIGDGAVGSARVVHAMQRERRGLEVALGHDAGLVDETLEVGAARNLRLVEVRGSAQRLEVDVDDGIALRQQASGFWRRLGAQIECYGERSQDGKSDYERDPRASSHQLSKFSLLANGQRLLADGEGEDLAGVGEARHVRGARWKHTVFAFFNIYGHSELVHLRRNLMRVKFDLVAL